MQKWKGDGYKAVVSAAGLGSCKRGCYLGNLDSMMQWETMKARGLVGVG